MATTSAPGNWIRKFDRLTLRLFLTVAEEGSLNRAATREAMTPSAATKRVQALEDGLNVQLIDRSSKGLRLTPAGDVVVRHLRHTLGNLQALHEELHKQAGVLSGALTVTANASTWAAFLAEDVARFSSANPSISLDLRDAASPNVVRAVLAGDSDIGVCPAFGTLPATLQSFPYRRDQLVAVAAPGHAAAAYRSLALQDLLAFDLMGWTPRGSLMRTVQQAAEEIGRTLQLRWRMKSVDSARALVRAGLGVAILPSSMAQGACNPQLRMIPIAEPWAQRRLHLITRADRPLGKTSEAFVQQIRHFMSS